MAVRNVEQEIERLNAAREATVEEAEAALRKALRDRVNLLVAKAAKIAAERRAVELIPDLAAAFDRLMEKPVERDAQCWGKTGVVKALAELGHRESAVFVRGVRHIQLEASWGRSEDTAGTVRAQCAAALPACTDLRRGEILRLLVDGLADCDMTVRIEAARALAQMDGDEAALVLRIKARMGDEESQVCGQVFDALLAIERGDAIDFISEFFIRSDQREEAALALGASRIPAAVTVLREALDGVREQDFRGVLLRAISASRQDAAIEFLIELVRRDGSDAVLAYEALKLHPESPEIWRRVEEARHSI